MSKLTIPRKALAGELNFVRNSVSGKTNDNWSYILFEANGNELKLTGTDAMSTACTKLYMADSLAEPVEFVIKDSEVCDIVNGIKTDTVTFSLAETRTTLIAGKNKWSFGVYPEAIGHIKPHLTLGVDGQTFPTKVSNFIQAAKIASMFAAKEEKTQYNLNGIIVDALPDKLIVAAMDNNRGADLTMMEEVAGRKERIFIGRVYIGLITTIAESTDVEMMDITNGENAIRIQCGNRIAVIRKSAAENLPPISMAIDKRTAEADATMEVDQAVLLQELHLLNLSIKNKYKRADCHLENGVLKLTSSKVGGHLEFDGQVEVESADKATFSINSEFAYDCLKHMEGKVKVRYIEKANNRAGGVIFTDNNGFRYMMSLMV